MARLKAHPDLPNEPGERLLVAIARHHALTEEQAVFACGYEPTSISHVVEHLKRLTDHGYLRFVLPESRYLKKMFLLDERGKRYLHAAGVPIDEPTGKKPPVGMHLAHRQLVTWVILQLELTGCELLEARNEWQLSRQAVSLTLHGGKQVNYAPDAFVRLRLPNGREHAIAVELDRGSENLSSEWTEKVRQMVAFTTPDIKGTYPFQQLFGVATLRFAVIAGPGALGTTPKELRAQNLVHWTDVELKRIGAAAWAPNFFIRPADPQIHLNRKKPIGIAPTSLLPQPFFFAPCWAHPGSSTLAPLLGGTS